MNFYLLALMKKELSAVKLVFSGCMILYQHIQSLVMFVLEMIVK